MPGRTKSPVAPILLLLAASLASRGGAAQPVSSSAQQPQAPSVCTIGGVVRNSLTNQPVERALVDGQMDAALTDSEGRFELHLGCGGYAQLQVRRPGYASPRGGVLRPVWVGADAPDVTLKVTPMASITGHVSVSNGGDAGELYFQAYRAAYWHGRLRWSFAGQAKTDANGTFRMYDLESPARYLLCNQLAQEHTAAPTVGKVTYGYPMTCYPPATGAGSEGLLQLDPGQQAEAEISLTRQPFYRVAILESSPEGQRQGLTFYNQSGANVSASLRWKDEDQSWEAWLPNGMYYAEARAWGPSPAYGRVDVKVSDTGVGGLRMNVVPLAPVEVVIHKLFTAKSNEQPANDANPGIELELIPVEPRLEGSGGGVALVHAEGDEPGHFEAQGVTPGRYWVQASYFGDGYVSALSSGATDLTREPLVIGPGNSVAPIEVTVRNDGGTIECTVNNSANTGERNDVGRSDGGRNNGFVLHTFVSNGPVVYAIPTGPRFSRLPQSSFGPNGSVRIANLAPGLYRVVALSEFKELESADPSELAKLMERGKTVRVEAGMSTSVQVDVANSDEETIP